MKSKHSVLLAFLFSVLFAAFMLTAAKVNAASDPENQTDVFVEPWQVLVRQATTVKAGSFVVYDFNLIEGARLLAQFQVEGGLNDTIQVFFLDYPNFQLYSARRPFKYYRGLSGSARRVANAEFKVSQAGVYYLILDNRNALLLPRNVTLHVDSVLPQVTPESEEVRKSFEAMYLGLKKVFIFPHFQTTVRHCGFVNAFSNPNITLCTELLEEMVTKGMGSAIAFVYFHELGHTLMKQWGLPFWDNEDDADGFATALLLQVNQSAIALQAAQFWASQNTSTQDAVAKIWMDDRHSLSPQRARNIIRWVNNRTDLVSRWEHIFIPNMQTTALESSLHDSEVLDKNLVRAELARRGVSIP
ncbi:MAG TPA: DUF4344 domain-containing metallopeptidase [Terriglobia bacterium]|nr:DUF4344 domain-containing metallopeptidase [Terriglobia bacterium]